MSEQFTFRIEPWSVVEENKEYSTPIFNLLRRKMKLEIDQGTMQGTFYALDAPAWINVIALTQAEEVILVEQYRYGTERPTLEIPGGMVDDGEQPLKAAKRELLEETGYRSKSWESLGRVSANPAIMTNYTHLYVAKNCEFVGSANPDCHERIIVHKKSLDEFLKLVRNGTIHHAIVLAAVARFLLDRDQ